MSLPLLPGFILNPNVGKEIFNKPQKFTFENKVGVEKDKYYQSMQIHSEASKALNLKNGKPAWLAFDKYVLCFDAYFQEFIPRVSQLEKHRYRKCKIYYFLEDDTMEIIEPVKNNSGIPQGTIVKRHRFRKNPNSNSDSDSEYFSLYDLNVGITLNIYSRLYKTTSCDKFTRSFLSEIGVTVNEPVSEPADAYEDHRKLLQDTTAYKKPTDKKDKLGQFLNFNPHALRFYCLWDDTHNLFGTKRRMVLHYFLDDDTLEIIEQRRMNSGQCDTKVFLKRSKLPKNVGSLHEPGTITNNDVLNIGGLRGNDHVYNLDLNPPEGYKIEYYMDKDLDLGMFINVWGRSFFIYDCDDFTKMFYKLKYSRELVPHPIAPDVNPVPRKEDYPPNVFGGAEDTLQNCLSLIPKPYKKDLLKFYENDKYGWDSKQMTFSAGILTDESISKNRRFVITFYLCDDTIQIHEPHQENSGLREGVIMNRTKIEKKGAPRTAIPIYYSEEDFFVGSVLHIRGNDYLLMGANEYTYQYMEKNPEKFIHSNFDAVLTKLKDSLSEKCELLKLYFNSCDENQIGFVPFDVFRKTIYDAITEKIPEQEMITLARHYAVIKDTDLRWEEIQEMAQTELLKKNYNDFDNLSLALQEYDVEKKGTFTSEEMFLHLIACRLPLPRELLKCFLYKFPSVPGYPDSINYTHAINALNFIENPVSSASPVPKLCDINWIKRKTEKSLEKINYMAFIEDLTKM